MRPSLLDPLFAPVTTIDGIGERTAKLFANIVAADTTGRDVRIGDLLLTLPAGVIDRRNRPGIAYSPQGAIVTLEVRIDRHQPPPRGNRSVPYRVFAHDDTGEVALTFFRGHREWLEKQLPVGETVIVSGKMDWFNGRPSMVHPDHMSSLADAADLPLVEPVYPLTAGLSGKIVRKAVDRALGLLPPLPEWQDQSVIAQTIFQPSPTRLNLLHHPLDPTRHLAGKRRLAAVGL
jgi:ATP-dependent DNA helicase RecG